MSLEETLRNKKLLQVAAEIAGKGIGKTPEVLGGYGTDEQENIAPATQAAEQEPLQVTEEIVEFVLEKLKAIEESTGIELADRDLDFAIKTIVEGALQNLSEEIGFHPEGEGHETKGSVATDTIPPHVKQAVADHPEYSGYKTVGPQMHGQEGTVTVSYKSNFMGREDAQMHAVLAPADVAKSHDQMMSSYHDEVMSSRMRNRGFR